MTSASPDSGGRFATTRWTLIAAAQGPASPQAEDAVASLCEAYWYPLYAYIRRRGYSPDQAQDLTQGFFASLLEQHSLAMVDRARGRFRSFLLSACDHFLAHERDRAQAQKRGGGRTIVSLDFIAAEGRYGSEPADHHTPEKLFARRWALTLLEQVFARLRQEFAEKGKGELFDRLRVFLLGEKSNGPYSRVGDELGMTEGAVKVAAHRLRQRFRELLREEIGRTVDDADQVEEEIRELFAVLAG